MFNQLITILQLKHYYEFYKLQLPQIFIFWNKGFICDFENSRIERTYKRLVVYITFLLYFVLNARTFCFLSIFSLLFFVSEYALVSIFFFYDQRFSLLFMQNKWKNCTKFSAKNSLLIIHYVDLFVRNEDRK